MRPLAHRRAQVGREREERPGHGLRGGVAREEGVVPDPAGGDQLRAQQRQHHVTAPEHQRTCPVETVEQRDGRRSRAQREERKRHEEGREREERQRRAPAPGRRRVGGWGRGWSSGERPKADEGAADDHPDLGARARPAQEHRRGREAQGDRRGVRAEAAPHAPHRLRDHSHGGQLQAVQPAGAGELGHARHASPALQILGELKDSGLEWKTVGDTTPIHEAITYLTNNADRMNYAAARAAGLNIGSGTVEATCKSLVQVRMCRSGARWRPDTAQALLSLRALALSDRWDAAIALTLAPLRREVCRAA
jgi:hypothetical protein